MMQWSKQELSERISEIREKVSAAAVSASRNPAEIQIMAVTKTVPPEKVNFAYEEGIRLFGENRVQEYLSKEEQYEIPLGLFHFIGHLQTNKVKYIIEKVSCIESVGSLKLAEEIDRRASSAGIIMPILLEVNIASELSKSGFLPDKLDESLRRISEFEHISIQGLMCIPERGEGDYWFQKTQELFLEYQALNLPHTFFHTLSMGMSEDYEAAIRNGSTIVRLGRAMFGERG